MQKIDLASFLSDWWSGGASFLPIEYQDWIEQTHIAPAPLWEQLFAQHQEIANMPIKSSLSEQYDFYHDAVIRHSDSSHVVFTHIRGEDEREGWTYQQLHQLVNFQIGKWLSYEPQPGQLVALVQSPSIHFLVGLFSALRLGLNIFYLPPHTPFLSNTEISRILSQINPDFILTQDEAFAVSGIPRFQIDETQFDEEEYAPFSFAYEAKAKMFSLPALHRQDPLAFVSLDAETLYLHALRDSFVTFNLPKNSIWATPMACPIRTEPCSTFSTGLAAAQKIHVDGQDIENNPEILSNEKIHLLGVTSSLQKLWTRTPKVPKRGLRAYYLSPIDFLLQKNQDFVEANKLQKIPAFLSHVDSSYGGTTLFSRPTTAGPVPMFVKPSLGLAWTLADIDNRAVESETGIGLFRIHLTVGGNSEKEGNFILSSIGRNSILSRFLEPCKEGITYPAKTLERVVNSLSFVEKSHVRNSLQVGLMSQTFTLLVFVTPRHEAITDADKAAWTQAIEQKITDKLGRGFVPGKIEYYPLMPRRYKGETDQNWCEQQHKNGLLSLKVGNPLYQHIHMMKKVVVEPSTQKS